MRLLFLGDVMGKAGRDAVAERLPGLIEQHGFDFVIVNGENASHGRGLTEQHFELLRDAGADVVTLGDHAFDQREMMTAIERHDIIVRPINLPGRAPGRGAAFVTGRKGHQVLVVQALGRVFMPPMDDPFRAVEAAIEACPLGAQADAIIVDFHVEATSEIQGMGHFLDGRVTLVVGTHTHIPTSDHVSCGRHRADERCGDARRLRQRDRDGAEALTGSYWYSQRVLRPLWRGDVVRVAVKRSP